MKNRIVKTSIVVFFLSAFLFPQGNYTKNKDCPPLFTRIRTIVSEIKIVNIDVEDSANYDSQPRFIEDLETVAKKIIYPEIEKRAGVDGRVVLHINIDSLGQVIKGNILKGIGGDGIEESTLDKIKKEKFHPAMKNNKKIASQLTVTIIFSLNYQVDKPELDLDEIKCELHGGYIYDIRTIIFRKDGTAYFNHDRGYEPPQKFIGVIKSDLYIKLNDFIISQCFLDYESDYISNIPSDSPKTIITIKSGNLEKSITSQGKSYEPIGFWAIKTVILQAKESVKWEEVKE